MAHLNYCPNCGKELTTHANFCPNCGYNLAKLDASWMKVQGSDPNDHPATSSPQASQPVRVKLQKVLNASQDDHDVRALWNEVKQHDWAKMGLTGLAVFLIMLAIFRGIGTAFLALLLIILIMVVGGAFIVVTQPRGTDDSSKKSETIISKIKAKADTVSDQQMGQKSVSQDNQSSSTNVQSAYTIRTREFITVVALLLMVAATYFGNYFSMEIPIIHRNAGMTLAKILNGLGYYTDNAKYLLLALSILPAVGIILVIIPNGAARGLSTIVTLTGDALVGYILYLVSQYQGLGKLLNVQPDVSFWVMLGASGIATIFSISSLFPKRVS